ncbi:MAG TPA: arginine deiminase family protein [Pirellulales bacterium]|nr:arginine deiminase family protein [Pirellulales bacterium]
MTNERLPQTIVAVTRQPSASLARCELLHLPRREIDYAQARRQHSRYEDELSDLGCVLLRLPPAAELPDAVFVEDTCLVLDDLAIVARPGVPSRRPETEPLAGLLGAFRPVAFIEAPGTLDGGDVVRLGNRVFVGLSSRTNGAGLEQLAAHLVPRGYTVHPVSLNGCLHLKTALTAVSPDTLLVNRSWVAAEAFAAARTIDVHPDEPFGANALLVNGTVLHSASHPRTRERLEGSGIRVRPVEFSELEKAEAGVTCCCVLFDAGLPPRR